MKSNSARYNLCNNQIVGLDNLGKFLNTVNILLILFSNAVLLPDLISLLIFNDRPVLDSQHLQLDLKHTHCSEQASRNNCIQDHNLKRVLCLFHTWPSKSDSETVLVPTIHNGLKLVR